MRSADDEAVSQYLQAIEAARAAPEGFLDPDKAASALARAEMMAGGENQEDLEAQLAGSVPGSEGHLRKLEDDFVRVAAGYGERHGMSYEHWRQTGVEPDVLARAGIEGPAE
jgi:hypothetical protein